MAPTAGIFVAENFSIGLTPQYEYSQDKSEYSNTVSNYYNHSSLLGGGLDFRYYWTIIPQLAFFTQLSGSYLTSVGGNNDYEVKQFNANITPNFAFLQLKNLLLFLDMAF